MLASDLGNVLLAQQLIAHGASYSKSTKVRDHRMWPLTFATRREDVPMMQTILVRTPTTREGTWAKTLFAMTEVNTYVEIQQ